jgi:hypothetical protein
MNTLDVAARSPERLRDLRPRIRALVAALELFVSIGALYGGYNLMMDAEALGWNPLGSRERRSRGT